MKDQKNKEGRSGKLVKYIASHEDSSCPVQICALDPTMFDGGTDIYGPARMRNHDGLVSQVSFR